MNIIFTPASLLEILNQIDELKDYNISVTETLNGNIQIEIGDSTYQIDTDNIEEVEVPEDVVDTVEDINEETYEELVDSEEFESTEEVVEGGFLKEDIKSLLLGGAVKLIKKLL